MHPLSIDDLARELGKVTSRADAKALVNRASRVAGLPSDRPLDLRQLLMVCHALAAEGGAVQTLAERIAARSLGEAMPFDADASAPPALAGPSPEPPASA